MRQVQRVLANYSADLFGICSALYELGGLIVMHDASGCNSTYNTHDEPRWYDMDSMIYVSGLTEQDAILGNDNRLINDVLEAAEETHPKFIVICGSPMPYLIGTDFPGIARVIEKKCGIPTFGFKTNGMHTYVRGAQDAFAGIAERFCQKRCDRIHDGISCNLLGVTPLDFSVVGNVEALKSFIRQNGFILNSTWAMGDSLEKISVASAADVNVVVSSTGLPAAKVLREKFGTPYVIGLPAGPSASEELLRDIHKAVPEKTHSVSGDPNALYSPESADQHNDVSKPRMLPVRVRERPVIIIGEAVLASATRTCLQRDLHIQNVRIVCPTEEDCGLLCKEDVLTDEEDEITKLVNEKAGIVIADPLYRRVIADAGVVKFIDFPHEAYSGRMYHSLMPVFIGDGIREWLMKKLTDGDTV